MKRITRQFLTGSAVCLGLLLSAPLVAQDSETNSGLTDADRLQIAIQKICPVSGQDLGSMGKPFKVKAGEQTVFLCCKGCQNKEIQAEHWKAIQARYAKAQKVCPIMKKAVSAKSKFTVVDGKPVFVCCPPCIDKIQKDVAASMKLVNENYVAFLKSENGAAGAVTQMAAQAICPVSGRKLNLEGKPITVNVDGQTAFVCCSGCAKKEVNAEHWKTVQANLAKAQGVCPVMGKPVSAKSKSTLVDGRRVFVCCPPCIAKIQKDPKTYLAKVDASLKKSASSKE